MNCCGNSSHSNEQKDGEHGEYGEKNQGSRIFSILHWIVMLAVAGYLIVQFLK